MKLLTGKCKSEFLKHIQENSIYTNYSNSLIKYEYSERGEFIWFGNETNLLNEYKFLNALIIDFFDSVGIYISIETYQKYNNERCFLSSINDDNFKACDTRQQATEEAIKKANEIFNNR